MFIDVNFKIVKGEFVFFIGYLGCGKFIVLNIVVGLYIVIIGGVIFDGVEVNFSGFECVVVF